MTKSEDNRKEADKKVSDWVENYIKTFALINVITAQSLPSALFISLPILGYCHK